MTDTQHDADCPSRDGFYPENCECSHAPWRAAQENDCCDATLHDDGKDWAWNCTLDKGHSGDHQAFGFSDLPYRVWPQEVANAREKALTVELAVNPSRSTPENSVSNV